MGIFKMTMYGCGCDNCGEHWRDDHSGYICFTDAESMQANVSDDGDWYTEHAIPDKHYCPKCWNIDDEDNLNIRKIEKGN